MANDPVVTADDAFCDELYASRPAWTRGMISKYDARYLYRRVARAGAGTVVEIGTSSGVSTLFICYALHHAYQAGRIGPNFKVLSYDIRTHFYDATDILIGQAAMEVLRPDLLQHVEFRNPATAPDVRAEHELDSLGLVFIDADHRHPWPTLDLLAFLDVVRPGGEVVLHDINLPVAYPEFQDWGAKHLFDDAKCEKLTETTDVGNIGSILVPLDKETLRGQLHGILDAHPWEVEVPPDAAARALERFAS